MSEERFDRLESKIDAVAGSVKELQEGHKELAGSVKELQEGHKELVGNMKELQAGHKELAGSMKDLQGNMKELQEGHKELAASQKQVVEMMAQMMKIVGETNRKVTDIAEGQQEMKKEMFHLSSTSNLHKFKIANLEEHVNVLQATISME